MKVSQKFENFKLNKQLYLAIQEAGYKVPTNIQSKIIPLVLSGHDVIGIAQTGTGKTAAYLIPIIMNIKYAKEQHPRVLILAPTRELALQIDKNLKELSKYTDLRTTSIYGGTSIKLQIDTIKNGIDILIATPGRFLDLYFKEKLFPRAIKTLVIDEADKMMDMGFMPQIRNILEVIPSKRQNILMSATMSDYVKKLSEEFLEFPRTVVITPNIIAVETVKQVLYSLPNIKSKINMLKYLLKNKSFNRVIVFVKTKTIADNIGKYLSRKNLGSVKVIHSNKGQNSRVNTINEFKEGNVRILVSTDISSRGIDITNVSHVINFNVPIIYEDYVHRIGRTGRANKKGIAITFADKAELMHLKNIEKLIKETITVKKVPQEVELTKTEKQEQIEIEKEIDLLKKRENPDFKGAFHDKKKNVLRKKKIR